MDDGERIRQKRLAKLAAASTASSSAVTPDASVTSKEPPSPAPPAARIKTESKPQPMDVYKPADIRPPVSKLSPSASQARLIERFLSTSDEDWECETLESIFQCSVDPEVASKNGYTALPDLVAEFQSEGTPLKITAAQVERVLYARLSLEQNALPTSLPLFDYLIDCWKRIRDSRRRLNTLVEKVGNRTEVLQVADKRRDVLSAIETLVMNYSGLVVNPDMAASFPQPPSVAELGPSYIAKKLLLPNADEAENALPREFLEEFINRFNEDGLDEILGYIATSISANMREQSLLKDYHTPFRALGVLASFKPVTALLPFLKNWNPPTNAKTIELVTLLGPFFSRVSSFPDSDPAVADHYFGSSNVFGESSVRMPDGFPIGSRNPGDVRSALTSLRGLMDLVQSNLYNIVMNVIRAGPQSREKMLEYFSNAINVNKRRGRMQVDPREVSTDGFMYNMLQVALKLTDPIMGASYSKIHLIDPDYFNYSSRLDISDNTRINADKDMYEQYLRQWRERNPNPEPANFISDVFYLTLGLHHYGLMSSLRRYTSSVKQIEELRKHVEKMKLERDSGAWAGPIRIMSEEMLKRFQKELDKLIGQKLAMDTAIRNRTAIEHSLRFYDLVMMWLIRCALTGTPQVQHPANKNGDGVDWGCVARGDRTGLPLSSLPETLPLTFTALPEWIIEDVCDFYLFVMRYEAPIFEFMPRDELLTFTMTFLGNPQYIKNPHLKSKFVEILFTFTWPLWRTESGQTSGKLDGVFSTHPLAKDMLVSNLMRFYVDVEHTGVSSQFYDKFNIRYNISQILKSVWADSGHRRKVIAQSQNGEFFVRFVALLMNDTTYLLDESLSKLKQIQQLQIELADPLLPTASQEEQQRREERSGFLRQLEGQAISYMSLGNETVHMLQYMTANAEIVQPFMEPEIVERLAAMLDYNLAALVGPRCTDLKVKNPEKYRFEPKRLLRELMDIYIHLAHREEFVAAVAKDERSYRKDLFVRAAGILLKNMLKSEDELAPLYNFVEKVEVAIRTTHAEEEELGDAPDEFLDPLLYHIMEDPVILPSSGLSIDRSTIKSHLLSDAHDPFNRQPLSIEQVIPNDDLRQKILNWKRSKKRTEGTSESLPMDTS